MTIRKQGSATGRVLGVENAEPEGEQAPEFIVAASAAYSGASLGADAFCGAPADGDDD